MRASVMALVVVAFAASAFGCKGDSSEGKKLAKEGKKELFRTDAIAEAKRSLGAIEMGAKAAFDKDHRVCASAKAKIPGKVPSGQKEIIDAAAWFDDPWKCLQFKLETPVWCQYDFQSNGKDGAEAAFTATATCDPEGGKPFAWKLEAKSNGDATELVRSSFAGPDGP